MRTAVLWFWFGVVNLVALGFDLYAVVAIPGHRYFLIFALVNLAVALVGIGEWNNEQRH